jgi:UDP-N-acetylglucosamine--N-acetylmuramyl-(pentapeptide) pyrophosphoryl-undecaprenol N-acetylglucosamine transferase
MKKILLTGGHAGTTGLSVIKEIRRRKIEAEISWIGVKRAVTGSLADTLEYKIFPKHGVNFYSFEVGKVQTKFTRYTIPLLFKIPLSFIKIFIKTYQLKPDVIVSFGGSTSLPVVFCGYILGVPVIVHEQTSVAGRANLMASKFAKIIAISKHSSEKFYSSGKVVLTGNPLSPEIKKFIKRKRRSSVKKILITGGSRGSVWINNALMPIVEKLSRKYMIFWQVGENNLDKINYKNPNIKVFGQIDPDDMVRMMADSDIVVSRAGANTVSELIALRIPSILIPIPWSYLNEQTENANYMSSLGLCKILPQRDLNPENLLDMINKQIVNYPKIVQSTKNIQSSDIDADKRLVEIISSELNDK